MPSSITIKERKITANKRSLLFHLLMKYKKEGSQNRGIDKTKTVWLHPFNTYAKLSEKLTFLTADQGVRNVSFSENFAYVLNGWSPFNVAFCFFPVWTWHYSQNQRQAHAILLTPRKDIIYLLYFLLLYMYVRKGSSPNFASNIKRIN